VRPPAVPRAPRHRRRQADRQAGRLPANRDSQASLLDSRANLPAGRANPRGSRVSLRGNHPGSHPVVREVREVREVRCGARRGVDDGRRPARRQPLLIGRDRGGRSPRRLNIERSIDRSS